MKQVRVIIKETHQPPIDTPASIKMLTIVIESDRLHEMLLDKQAGRNAIYFITHFISPVVSREIYVFGVFVLTSKATGIIN